jgi:hypothetical protein
MNLIIIDGYMGAGKTLAMTLLSVYFQSLSDCALYSNYGITGSKEFSHYKDFLNIANESSTIVALDEAHTDLDSRNYSTNAVKFFTHLIFYMRKLRCTVFLATPSIDNLDGRVRGISNLYIHVTKNREYFIYDCYDIQSERFLKQYKIRQHDAISCSELLYNTYNMVLPVTFPDDRKEFLTFLPELKQASETFYLNGMGNGRAGMPPAMTAEPSTDDVQAIYYSGQYASVV